MRYTNRTGKNLQRRDKHHRCRLLCSNRKVVSYYLPVLLSMLLRRKPKTIAEFFAAKLKNSTGFNFAIADAEKDGGISLLIDPAMEINEEGYRLDVLHKVSKSRPRLHRVSFMVCKVFCNCCLPKWRVLQWSKTSNGVHLA